MYTCMFIQSINQSTTSHPSIQDTYIHSNKHHASTTWNRMSLSAALLSGARKAPFVNAPSIFISHRLAVCMEMPTCSSANLLLSHVAPIYTGNDCGSLESKAQQLVIGCPQLPTIQAKHLADHTFAFLPSY